MAYVTLSVDRMYRLRSVVKATEDFAPADLRQADGPEVFVYVVGGTGSNFWCPDCERDHAHTQKVLLHKVRTEATIVVEIQVETMESYQNEACPIKQHAQISPHVYERGIPCLISWPSVTSFLDGNVGTHCTPSATE